VKKSYTESAVVIPALALRPKQAAASLGVSERTLWAWTAAGEVPHVRKGKAVLYPVELLQKWLAKKATGGEERR
jgi:excisionase family DNA binding protein